MKIHPRALIFLSFLVTVLSCNNPIEKKNKDLHKKHKGYIIEGTLAKGNFKKVYLLNSKNEKVDSAKVSKYQFLLKGKTFSPEYSYISFDKDKQTYPLILENTKYKMLINGDNSMIIGGDLNTKLSDYNFKKKEFAMQKSKCLDEFSKLNLSLRDYLKQVDSIRKIEDVNFNSFIEENSNNIISSILLENISISSKNAIRLRSKLKNTKNSELLRKMDTLISHLKLIEAEDKILRRKPVPLFSGVNLAGRQTHLEKIIKGKKAFLIDFWASWCPPCRASSPKLKALYSKYKPKGFDILTVSEDRSVDEWKSGVFIDEIESWHHIYDDYNRISSMFNVGALPHMVLIDENGKIIKNNISLSSLEEQLEKIFGE